MPLIILFYLLVWKFTQIHETIHVHHEQQEQQPQRFRKLPPLFMYHSKTNDILLRLNLHLLPLLHPQIHHTFIWLPSKKALPSSHHHPLFQQHCHKATYVTPSTPHITMVEITTKIRRLYWNSKTESYFCCYFFNIPSNEQQKYNFIVLFKWNHIFFVNLFLIPLI